MELNTARDFGTVKDSEGVHATSSPVRISSTARRRIIVHRSLQSLLGKITLLCLTVVAVGMLAFTFPGTLFQVQTGTLGEYEVGLVIPVFAVVPLTLLLIIVFQTLNRYYVIGPDSVRQVVGILSPGLSSIEIYYRNVRSIRVSQNPWQRLLGVGDVRVGSHAADGDIVFVGVRKPYHYKRMIENRLKEHQ